MSSVLAFIDIDSYFQYFVLTSGQLMIPFIAEQLSRRLLLQIKYQHHQILRTTGT
jgi:hypothetical protein